MLSSATDPIPKLIEKVGDLETVSDECIDSAFEADKQQMKQQTQCLIDGIALLQVLEETVLRYGSQSQSQDGQDAVWTDSSEVSGL
jgi:hypothetical protein